MHAQYTVGIDIPRTRFRCIFQFWRFFGESRTVIRNNYGSNIW